MSESPQQVDDTSDRLYTPEELAAYAAEQARAEAVTRRPDPLTDPLDDPLVSPLLADLSGLGPVTAASGTRDVLHRDALRLEQQVPLADGVRVLVGRGLLHNYPLLPVPEARPALAAFVDALR